MRKYIRRLMTAVATLVVVFVPTLTATGYADNPPTVLTAHVTGIQPDGQNQTDNSNIQYSVTYSGFVNGDDSSIVTGNLNCYGSPQFYAPHPIQPVIYPEAYIIATCSGLSVPSNYKLVYDLGTITVETPGAPSAVKNLNVTPGAGQATATWSAPDSEGDSAITSYTILARDMSDYGQEFLRFDTYDTSDTSQILKGFITGDIYKVWVIANNANHFSSPTTVSATVTPTPGSFTDIGDLPFGPYLGQTPNSSFTGDYSGSFIPNGGTSQGINDSGKIVSNTCCYVNGNVQTQRAVTWTPASGPVELQTPQFIRTDVFGMNNKGDIVGSAGNGFAHAYLWPASGGSPIDIGSLGGKFGAYGRAINENGEVVGSMADPSNATHAFIWTQSGGVQLIGKLPGAYASYAMDVNDAGVVVGFNTYNNGSGDRAYMWTPTGGMVDLGSGDAFAINDNGIIVGSDGNSSVYWTLDGQVHDIGEAGTATAINKHNQIIGQNGFGSYIWSPQNGTQDLPGYTDIYTPAATGINNNGKIVGSEQNPYSSNGAGDTLFWQTSVPDGLPAPTNLTAQSPTTQAPELSWDSVDGAESYNIYRNGVMIDSSTTNSYTDTMAPNGTNTYTVAAVNFDTGEGHQSNSINVVVNRPAPTITYTVTPTPNNNGWNNTGVTVTFSCSDEAGGSGIASCSPPMTESSDGTYTLEGSATDNAGNTSTVDVTVNVDQSSPMVGMLSWSDNPIIENHNTTLTVPAMAAANHSPITGGEYYIGTNDPGQGNGTAMSYDSNTSKLTATFGSTLAPGTYEVSARSQNAAGTWSSVVTDTLVVNSTAVAPTITNANNYSIGVRQIITPSDFTFTTTGTPAPSLSESGTLPSGLSFTDNGDGTANFTGMVAAGTAGTYPITITATNSAGSVSQSFTLTITNTDSAPTTVFTSTGSNTLNATVGTGSSFTFTATGNGKNSKIFVYSGSLPPGLSLHDNKDGTASFFGTPTHAGTYTFTLEAQNKNGITYQQFTVVVS